MGILRKAKSDAVLVSFGLQNYFFLLKRPNLHLLFFLLLPFF